MKTYLGRGTDERGAILIQVAISIVVLTAFSAFVVDQGVLLVARNQAQTAADAGALAGAVALAYDETTYPPTSTGMAFQSAQKAAHCASGSSSCPTTPLAANPVWPSQAGASSAVNITWICPPGFTGKCVRVDVYRDGQGNGSTPLPVFFAPLLGITSQGIRATASARSANATAVNCMRPFSVADKWNELYSPIDQYNHYDSTGNVLAGTPDQYLPPTSGSAGTGYRATGSPNDIGTQVTLMLGNPTNNDPVMKSWSLPLRLPDGHGGYLSGGNDYRDAIAGCKAGTVTIGDYLSLETGAMTGPTDQGFTDLTALDPGATFNPLTNPPSVQGGCVPSCGPISPRVIPLAVFDMDEYQWRRATNKWGTEVYTDANGGTHLLPGGACPGTGNRCVRVVNILGFFAASITNGNPKTVIGNLMSIPGTLVSGTPSVSDDASFLHIVQLIR
jgi:hypothetical protein